MWQNLNYLLQKEFIKRKERHQLNRRKKQMKFFEAIQPAKVIMPKKEVTEDPDGLHLVFKGTV